MDLLLSERQHGNLPNTSEVNPRREGKEHCKAITLRSGKTLEQSVEAQEEEKNLVGDEESSAEIAKDVERLVKKAVSDTPDKVEVQKPKYDEKTIISYLQRLRKNRLDK